MSACTLRNAAAARDGDRAALAFLVTGSFVVESLFAIPGVGYLGVQAIAQRDYPVIQGTTVILAIAVVLMNLITDILYTVLDPRIKAEG